MRPIGTIFVLFWLAFIAPAAAVSNIISATPITQYRSVDPGGKVDQLIWRGGLVLAGPEKFGGVSGITFIDANQLVMLTDKGQFISARLRHSSDGRPEALTNVQLSPVKNSKGAPLPSNYSRDSEAITTIYRNDQPIAVRVGFENLTRVADFSLVDGRPVGPAREVAIPSWISAIRTNQSIESVCIAPNGSPIAGSTLLLLENVVRNNAHSGWILGNRDQGPVFLKRASGFKPTDCEFLPNGDLLVLERGTGFFSFTMQVRRIKAENVTANTIMAGQVILTGYGGDIDNMEGLAVRTAKDGSMRIVIVSDDNFNDWERTLLLEFELID